MSTKIFNAWKLPHGVSPFDLVREIRALILPVRRALDAQWQVSTAVQQLDRVPLGRAHEKFDAKWPLLGASFVLRAEQAQIPASQRGHDPHRFEIVFIPDPIDSHQFYAQVFAEDEAILAALSDFAAEHDWRDFHYQDQTDRPDGVSERQWDTRRETWERIVPSGVPADVCLGMTVSPPGRSNGPAPFMVGIGRDEQEALEAALIAGPVERLRRLVLDYGAGRIIQAAQVDQGGWFGLVIDTAKGFDAARDPRIEELAERIMLLGVPRGRRTAHWSAELIGNTLMRSVLPGETAHFS